MHIPYCGSMMNVGVLAVIACHIVSYAPPVVLYVQHYWYYFLWKTDQKAKIHNTFYWIKILQKTCSRIVSSRDLKQTLLLLVLVWVYTTFSYMHFMGIYWICTQLIKQTIFHLVVIFIWWLDLTMQHCLKEDWYKVKMGFSGLHRAQRWISIRYSTTWNNLFSANNYWWFFLYTSQSFQPYQIHLFFLSYYWSIHRHKTDKIT
jgi:hypothetical protein